MLSDPRWKKSATVTLKIDDPTVTDVELSEFDVGDLRVTMFAETGEKILTYGAKNLLTKRAKRCWAEATMTMQILCEEFAVRTPSHRVDTPDSGLPTAAEDAWSPPVEPEQEHDGHTLQPVPTVHNRPTDPPEQSHEALVRRLQEAEEEIRRLQGVADDQQQRIDTLEGESNLRDQRLHRLQQWIESTLGVEFQDPLADHEDRPHQR